MSEPTTEARFLRSTVASYSSQIGRLVIAFGLRVALARLVLPGAHGLFELAFRIVTIASALRDLGLPYHLMRDPRRPYGTVLLATTVLGVVLTAALALASPWSVVLDPELPAVLAALAPWVLLDGLSVVPRVYFERELRIDRLVGPEILRAAAAAAVAIPLAAAGFGVWSLVAAELVSAAALAALLWRRARPGLALVAEPRLLPGLVRASSSLFGIWLLMLLVSYVDVYVVAAFTDTRTVGEYARAYFLAFLVQAVLTPRSLIPALVAYRDDPDRFVGSYRVAMSLFLLVQVVAGYFVFFAAERVVAILLGPGWENSVPLLRILCFVPFLDPFTKLGGEVLKAHNRERVWLFAMALNLVTLLAAGIPLTSRLGAAGMAWANYAPLGAIVMGVEVARLCGRRFRPIAVDLVWAYLVPLPAFLAAAWLTPAAGWARFFASGLAAAVAAVLLAVRLRGPLGTFRAARAPADPPR